MPELENTPRIPNPIDPTVARIIKNKARRMVGRAGLQDQDRDDLEQELVVHVLKRRRRFERSRGTWVAFVRCIVDRHGNTLIRARLRAKRNSGPVAPLTEEIPAADCGYAALVRAVDAAVETLPEHLRRVVELVRRDSVASAARTLRVSRATVYTRLRELRNRVAFRDLRNNP